MPSNVSKAKAATVQDVDDKTDKTISGTKVSASSSDKRKSTSKDKSSRRHTMDNTSESGRSNHTYETLASADSAKAMPRAPDAPKERPTPPATDAAPALTPPEPTKTTSPKKSSRTSSPGKKHRRAESKSSKKSADPHAVASGPCACQECAYRYAYPYGGPPQPHPAYHAPYTMEPTPSPYYPPHPAEMAAGDYQLDRRPSLRRSSRPRPMSFHTAPPGTDPYAMTAPTHLVGYGDPQSHFDHGARPDYFDHARADGAVDVLPTIRQSPQVVQRPIMHHAHTDYPSNRHSAFIEYPPVFDSHEADMVPYEYSSSFDTRRTSFPAHVDPYFRRSSRSPTRSTDANHRRPSRDDASYPPVSMRVGRKTSLKQQHPDSHLVSARAPSRSRRDRSLTDVDSAREYRDSRPSGHDSHSRRRSQQIGLSAYEHGHGHSKSPGHRYTSSESRSQRPVSYYSYDDREKYSKRHSRDLHNEPAPYDKFSEARKYQEAVTGHKDEDELTRSTHRSYGNPTRRPPPRSAHSGRSRHSGRSDSDIQVQVKVIQNGQTISKSKIAGAAEISVTDDGDIWTKDRSYHGGSSARSTSSVFSGLFRRGSNGKSRPENGYESTRESRRRSRVASPIVEDPRERRESRRY